MTPRGYQDGWLQHVGERTKPGQDLILPRLCSLSHPGHKYTGEGCQTRYTLKPLCPGLAHWQPPCEAK